MTLYGLKSCDTCRAALKTLKQAGQAVDFVDVRATPLSVDFLSNLVSVHGAKVVNTRSTTWRNLDDTARQIAPVALLQAHPTLMKRPVIEQDGTLYLGWSDAVRSALIG